MKQGIIATLILAAIGGFIITGCGGDDETSRTAGGGADNSANADSASGSSPADDSATESGGETIPKAAFLKKGNAICNKTVKDIVNGVLPVLEEGEKEEEDREAVEIQLAEEVMIPELRSEVDQIRALGTPPGDEKRVETVLGAIEEVIEEGEEDPTTLVKRGNSGFNKSSKVANRYGLDSCPYG